MSPDLAAGLDPRDVIRPALRPATVLAIEGTTALTVIEGKVVELPAGRWSGAEEIGDDVLVAYDEIGEPWIVSPPADMATQTGLDAVSDAAVLDGDAAGGVLSGTYPNPGIAAGVIPSSLPPSGSAGGALAGSYPNPTLADGVVDGKVVWTGEQALMSRGTSTASFLTQSISAHTGSDLAKIALLGLRILGTAPAAGVFKTSYITARKPGTGSPGHIGATVLFTSYNSASDSGGGQYAAPLMVGLNANEEFEYFVNFEHAASLFASAILLGYIK